jgi:hypothetical protein
MRCKVPTFLALKGVYFKSSVRLRLANLPWQTFMISPQLGQAARTALGSASAIPETLTTDCLVLTAEEVPYGKSPRTCEIARGRGLRAMSTNRTGERGKGDVRLAVTFMRMD